MGFGTGKLRHDPRKSRACVAPALARGGVAKLSRDAAALGGGGAAAGRAVCAVSRGDRDGGGEHGAAHGEVAALQSADGGRGCGQVGLRWLASGELVGVGVDRRHEDSRAARASGVGDAGAAGSAAGAAAAGRHRDRAPQLVSLERVFARLLAARGALPGHGRRPADVEPRDRSACGEALGEIFAARCGRARDGVHRGDERGRGVHECGALGGRGGFGGGAAAAGDAGADEGDDRAGVQPRGEAL